MPGLLDGRFDGGALEGVERLTDLTDLVLLVVQPRRLGLDVDLLARGEAPHDARQPYAGRPRGLPDAGCAGRGRGCGRRVRR